MDLWIGKRISAAIASCTLLGNLTDNLRQKLVDPTPLKGSISDWGSRKEQTSQRVSCWYLAGDSTL